ncbi:MAG: Na(+)/H(+) antiporter subunit B [Aggregatilineales bacterium]
MIYAALIVIATVCGIQALRMPRLLPAALWLAGTSAAVAMALYLMGAVEAAVIELSVGAGLVTVLLVFAITMAGDEPVGPTTVVPRRLALLLIGAGALLLLWLVAPLTMVGSSGTDDGAFSAVFWHARSADVLAQVLLIFTGVLCLVGLMIDTRNTGGTAHDYDEGRVPVKQAADALPEEELA